MPTLLRLSKHERDILREAFRRSAWLEPDASAPNDPDRSEWAAFEDDALFAMVPAFEAIMEARAQNDADEVGRTKPASDTTAGDTTAGEDVAGGTRKGARPGDSFGDFLSDMAAPLVGEVAGFIVASNWGGASTARPKFTPIADLLGMVPNMSVLLDDLINTQQDKNTKGDEPTV